MTLHAHHAHTLARLLAGDPVNGESLALPEPFRPIARRLPDLPPGGRKPPWAGSRAGRDDRDEIVMALASAPPEGPPPEAPPGEDEAGDDWGPIPLGTLPPAEPFPVEVLPEAM